MCTKFDRLSDRHCPKCSHDCGFVSRGLEYKCDKLDLVERGYQYALEDVTEWLKPYKEVLGDVVNKFRKDFGL